MFRVLFFVTVLVANVAGEVDNRTIKEAYGKDATVSPCLSDSVLLGKADGGTRRSDTGLLVSSDVLSLETKVTAIKVCTLPNIAMRADSLL